MQGLTKQTLKIYWQHTKKYWPQLIVVVLGIALVTATDLTQPFMYKNLLNFVAGPDRSDISYPLTLVGFITLLAIGFNIGWRAVIAAANIFMGKTKRDLYRTCYDYVLNHSAGFFSDNFVGGLVAKMGRFDRSYERVADEIVFGGGRTIFLIIFTIGVLALNIPTAALLMGIWVVIYVICSVGINRYRMRYDLAASEQDSKTTAQLADSITNATTIKLFASERYEKKLFKGVTEEQYLRRRKAWDFSNYTDAVQGALMVTLEFSTMWLAVHLWQQEKITVGDFALLQAYMLILFHHLWDFGRNLRGLYQSMADANEMTEILTKPHAVADAPSAKKLRVPNGEIELKGVTFKYLEKQKVFSDFNLQIAGGERVAFVGPSGGGKTTIVKLLFRFYDIDKGAVLIDGQDIAQVAQESLRSNISLVPQDPILFHRSLMENIKYAKPGASDKEAIAAAKAAHCHEFISKLPKGYDTLVGERGVKLSGGERQRVAIARALLKNAPILVLDEATSSLDSESEHLIQDALQTLMRGKTTIVIAHRLSTIMAMDRIIVIDNGRVTEQGKHEELLKAKQGKYQTLWHIQAGSFANK